MTTFAPAPEIAPEIAPAPERTGATLDLEQFEPVIAYAREHAAALDRNEGQARDILPLLAQAGALDLGAPGNAEGCLGAMAQVVDAIAREDVSAAFTLWAHRMTLEYLASAGTDYALELIEGLRTGATPGVTGMASAFRELAGCGSLDLTATPTGDGGYVVTGPIRWASNLYPDAVIVTAARTDRGERIIFATPLETAGLSAGTPFPLLGLNATASSYLRFEEVRIEARQVLSDDFEAFLGSVRGTFLALQTALCLGVATTSITNARERLTGVNAVFSGDVDRVLGHLQVTRTAMRDIARRVGTADAPARAELLSMRLAAAEVATDAATLEVKTAGGAGYARNSGASRRFREAFFIPVQSPSEAQLRWELAQCQS